MGMDIYGNTPRNGDGEYFRANVWSWGTILQLMDEANQRFSLGLDLEYFEFNQGAGLSRQGDCDRLAAGIEKLLVETDAQLFTLDSNPTGPEAAVLDFLQSNGWNVLGKATPEGATAVAPVTYSAQRSHVEEFVAFLRNCGGFRIW